jgi:competence protein ComEC
MVRPLPFAIALTLGIAVGPLIGIPAWAGWAAALLLAGAAPKRPELLVGVAFALGVARGARAPTSHPGVDDRASDRIVGTVAGPVARTRTGYLAEVAGVTVVSEEPLLPGERVAVTGVLRTPAAPRGPGLVAAPPELAIVARTVEHLADAPDIRARLWRWAADQQARWSAAIAGAGGSERGAQALRGIAVGDRSAVPPALDDRWRGVGIYHVLSVSGLHLAVIAGLAFVLLRRLVAASPWGGRVHPARWAAPPALALALGYTLITGGQIATVRALVVVALVMLGAALDRPLRLVDALGVAALAILVWRPADLWDPSFQLSFTAALVLALRPRGSGPWLVRGLAASAWVTLATAPLTAYHFQQVPAGGVIGNLVLTPALELAALPLALAGLLVGWDAPVALATWIVALVDRGAAALAVIAPVGHTAIASGALAAALVVCSLWLATRPRRPAIAWLALCAAWALGRAPPDAGALRVTFVDVGQGDAAIVELPDGRVWLVDAGGVANARDPAVASSPGRALDRILAVYGHDHVDVALLSHPHPDHYLGFAGMTTPIRELWLAPDQLPPGELGRIADRLAAHGTRLVHPALGVTSRGDVALELLAPRFVAHEGAAPLLAADPVRTVNDNSLVAVVRYRGRSIAFLGDVEAEGEAAALAAGLGGVDVVKVPHHGSPTSSSPALVATTHPAAAVISCGRANQFGFPDPAVVARWEAAGADVARTDRDGTVTVVVDAAGGLSVERFVRAPP